MRLPLTNAFISLPEMANSSSSWHGAWADGLSKAVVHQGSREPEVTLFMIAGHGYVLIMLVRATGVGARRRRRNPPLEMNVLPRPFSERGTTGLIAKIKFPIRKL